MKQHKIYLEAKCTVHGLLGSALPVEARHIAKDHGCRTLEWRAYCVDCRSHMDHSGGLWCPSIAYVQDRMRDHRRK